MHSAPRNNTMIQQQPARDIAGCFFLLHLIKASMVYASLSMLKCKRIFLTDSEDLGPVHSSAFWKASAGLVWMPLQLMSQLACSWKLRQPQEKSYLEHQTEEWYSDHSRHRSLWCYNAQNPPWHFHWKLKKIRHCKCQRGMGCSITFIQLCLQTVGRAATLKFLLLRKCLRHTLTCGGLLRSK